MKHLHVTDAVKLCAFLAMLSGAMEYNEPQDPSKTSLATHSSLQSLVIVSTLDGKLTALDARNGGVELWNLPPFSGPLLSSSLSSFQKSKQVRLIPSLDGGLYQVNGDSIEAIPYTADNLLGSFHELPDGSILVGGKEAISCGIDFDTGKVRYVCTADGCNLTESQEAVGNEDIFVLKRTQQTIRAVDQRTGNEKWNFSVGQQDISFLQGISEQFSGQGSCPPPDSVVYPEWNLRVSIPDGVVAAVQSQGLGPEKLVLWSQQFDSAIAAVWTFDGGHIQPVNLFTDDVMPRIEAESGLPRPLNFQRKAFMFLGSHNGQLYIHPSLPESSPASSTSLMKMSDSSKDAVKRNQPITWRPLLTSSPSRTPTVVSKELAVWNPLEYPYDNGYYLCGNVLPVIPAHGKVESLEEDSSTNAPKPHTLSRMPGDSMWDWWKSSLFIIVIVTAVIRVIFRHWKPQNTELPAAPKNAIDYQRIPSNTVVSGTSSASSETLNGGLFPLSPATLSPSDSFLSRYLSDFDHEQCLGKGGFGVVFQAKNKVDDCQYAIKRIRLPNCEEARRKVMREVKALAKLEHPGIVRYFNAWFEAPPAGWQEQVDQWMIQQGMYCGDDVQGLVSSESENVTESSRGNDFYEQNFFSDVAPNGIRRRRKETNSSTKSRQLSQTSSTADDPFGRKSTLVALDNDYDLPAIDVLQLENEAFASEQDESESFGIEFACPQGAADSISDHIQDFDESQSQSIVFANSGVSDDAESSSVPFEEKADVSLVSSSGSHSASNDSFEHEIDFSPANQSLLQGKQHKCRSQKCTSDILAAPLYLYIQMQLCQRKSLKGWLRENTERDYVFCLDVFNQIVSAVEYFHGSGMMHRDLKPSNIFFSLDGSVKVGDFGLVTATVHDSTAVETPYKGKNGFHDGNHTGKVGTHLYMSPEQMEGKSYSHKVDVYSLGIIFFELFYPFGTQMERIMVMSDVKAKKFPGKFSASMPLQAEFVGWLLSDTPKLRPNATEIKRSEMLQRITQQAHQSRKIESESG